MKKTLMFLLAISICTATNAQLKVNQFGNVSIGDDENLMLLGKANINGSSYVYNTYLKSGRTVLRIDNKDETTTNRTGIQINNYISPDTTTTGIYINTYNTSISTAQNVYGIRCYAGGSSHSNYALAGCLRSSSIISGNGSGIYGSSNVTLGIPEQYAGLYAGFFRGDVRVTGTIYGTLLTPSGTTSNLSTLSNTSIILNDENEIGSISDKLQGVQLLQYRREQAIPDEDEMENGYNLSTSNTVGKSNSLSADDNELLELEDSERLNNSQTILSEVKYGLAADQLKEVFPELVYEDGNGNVSINYIEMIPLLVQSINELKAEIASLKKGNSTVSKAKGTTAITSVEEETEMLSVSQNRPNPFTDKTTIDLSIPESVSKASLFIYDMNGKQVDRIDIADRGTTSVSIISAGLTEGMYLYSLVADGKIVSTKRMILTK